MREINITSPLVTVAMPVYNDEKYVTKAIKSIFSQNYSKWELIIVNDGSKDNTPKIIEEAIKDEPRARLVNKENGGTGSAINAALFDSGAKGKYYTWCSSDNIYYPNFLSSLVKALEMDEKYSFAYADFNYMNQHDQIFNQVVHRPIPRTDLVNGYDIGMAFLYTSDLQRKVGKYWHKIIEDYEFAIRAAQHTEFLLVSEFLAAFRVHGGQITGSRLDEERSLAQHCRDLAKELLLKK